MAHLRCECGKRLSNVCVPNNLEGEICGLFEYKKRYVWECCECGRLFIDVDDLEIKGCSIQKIYVPEDGKVGNLFDVGDGEQFFKYLECFWISHAEDLKKLGIIQDREPILNSCIQYYQSKLHELEEYIKILEEKLLEKSL